MKADNEFVRNFNDQFRVQDQTKFVWKQFKCECVSAVLHVLQF